MDPRIEKELKDLLDRTHKSMLSGSATPEHGLAISQVALLMSIVSELREIKDLLKES